MPNSSHGVKKETYVKADDETFKALTYDMLDSLHANVCTKYDKHEKRIEKLESRKKLDTGVSAGSGFLGGFIAVIIQKVAGIWQ